MHNDSTSCLGFLVVKHCQVKTEVPVKVLCLDYITANVALLVIAATAYSVMYPLIQVSVM